MNYKPYTHNQSMLSINICFNTSNSFLEDINNDLHFDEFIFNNLIISHKFFFNKIRNMSEIRNLYINNNSDKFFIKHIPEK